MERTHPQEEGRMATVLANPARMIERGAPHIIRNEEQLAAYTRELYRLTAGPIPRPLSSKPSSCSPS